MAETQQPRKNSLIKRGSKRGGRWLLAHPVGVIQLVLLILLLVIIAQNLEPTDIDVLLWTWEGIPKLILLVASMLAGAVAWEAIRQLFRRRR